jgi:hypothetical protein
MVEMQNEDSLEMKVESLGEMMHLDHVVEAVDRPA